MKQYRAVIYEEGLFGSLILGSSKIDPEAFSNMLNKYASQGWRVVTVEKEMRRTLLLWEREAYLVILERDI